MLAYVFWHWPFPDVEAHTYQKDLIDFHQTLATHRPPGYRYTRVLHMEQAPWLSRNIKTYEDWHLVEDSAALDLLNDAAVTGPCQEPHRRIARWTQAGTAGLYQLLSGEIDVPDVRFAYRFDKPRNISYNELYGMLQDINPEKQHMLWARRMNLGPGPEFCLHSSKTLVFPDVLATLEIPIEQLCITLHS